MLKKGGKRDPVSTLFAICCIKFKIPLKFLFMFSVLLWTKYGFMRFQMITLYFYLDFTQHHFFFFFRIGVLFLLNLLMTNIFVTLSKPSILVLCKTTSLRAFACVSCIVCPIKSTLSIWIIVSVDVRLKAIHEPVLRHYRSVGSDLTCATFHS